jgi:hypothetical protein
VGIMDQSILRMIYSNDVYLNYLRYHPKWYVILNKNPSAYVDFEKQLRTDLKITSVDKIEQLKKQIDFISGMLNYLNSQ